MSTASLGDTIRQLALPKFGRRLDYRAKLERQAPRPHHDREGERAAPISEDQQVYPDRVRALGTREQLGGVAFQSVAVAVLQVLTHVAAAERQAADASLSLGQREGLDRMTRGLEATAEALRTMLSREGEQMHRLNAAGRADVEEASWWFALTEAIQTVEDGIACVTGLVGSQPKGCAARALGSIVTHQLRAHHHALLEEADEWMG